jgi:hypothetical protein
MEISGDQRRSVFPAQTRQGAAKNTSRNDWFWLVPFSGRRCRSFPPSCASRSGLRSVRLSEEKGPICGENESEVTANFLAAHVSAISGRDPAAPTRTRQPRGRDLTHALGLATFVSLPDLLQVGVRQKATPTANPSASHPDQRGSAKISEDQRRSAKISVQPPPASPGRGKTGTLILTYRH